MIRPLPVADHLSTFFWEGAAEGRLLLQRCAECDRFRHPPSLACAECGSSAVEITQATGRGVLFSYAIPRRPRPPFLDEGTAVAVVELDEGVRLTTNVIDVALDYLEFGMPVQVDFLEVTSGVSLPVFRPSQGWRSGV